MSHEADEAGGPYCADCPSELEWVECASCGADGVTGHDCGDDTCCCVDPEDNLRCDTCDGEGGWWRCYSCHPLATLEVHDG